MTSFETSCMIQSGGFVYCLLYDINLQATHTMIPSTRGVEIHISLVSSTTDSIQQCIVVFKTVTILTSDLKSEFLCQSSLLLRRTCRPPETPHMPGISPTPSSPHITHIVITLALWPSTWSRSSVIREPSVLVAACQLKLSRTFHSNVTLTQTSTWLPPPLNTSTEGENETSPKDILKKPIGAKMDPLEPDITLLVQTTPQF